jgi:hypothetical protein
MHTCIDAGDLVVHGHCIIDLSTSYRRVGYHRGHNDKNPGTKRRHRNFGGSMQRGPRDLGPTTSQPHIGRNLRLCRFQNWPGSDVIDNRVKAEET